MSTRIRWACCMLLFACDEPNSALPTRPVSGAAYAVISSDWTSTAISLLAADGSVVADNYLNSGSAPAGLVTLLSGDVELPRHSGEPGVLVILDRFRSDVITRIRLADGAVLGQVKTHTPPDQNSLSAYSSNPHDYIYLDAQTAWITRSEPNLEPDAPTVDLGDDVLRIDPSTMQRTGERIDLGVLDQRIGELTLYARPTRMVRLGRTLVVGIARSAFDYKKVGDGVIALVDLDSKVVSGFSIPGLKNCSDVDTVPNDADTVLVTCGGDWNAASTKDTAGILLLSVANGTAAIEHQWTAKASETPFSSSTVALGGTLVGVAANDYAGSGSDVYAVLDVATGAQTVIKTLTPGSGAFGTPAFDLISQTLFLPDASLDADMRPIAGLRRFQRGADGSFHELALVRLAVDTDMPVRHIFPL